MDQLMEYLRGLFRGESDELHKVRDTSDEVLATLHRFKSSAQ